jgi:hypothetical protein
VTSFTGFILTKIVNWAREDDRYLSDRVTIDNQQQNGAHGIHQARVRLSGDPTTYRLILAPADAPIKINGHPIGEHFAEPIGD